MSVLDRVLERVGIQARPYRALVRALVLTDLRSQHYGRSTGTKPGELIPPLYWVLGQYLFISAIVSGILFARVGVESFALVNLTISALLAVSAVIVEFNEVVLDVGDLDIVGHRAVSRRTYAAARLTNLGFYVVLILTSLNLFPAILGAGLADSGPWFFPAYGFATVLGSGGAMLLAIIGYSLSPPRREEQDIRDMLAWVQIIVALLAFYGAQLMLRDSRHAIELFLDEPPSWVGMLPTAWLAAFVLGVVQAPAAVPWPWVGGGLLGGVLVAWLAWLRLMAYYGQAQTASAAAGSVRAPGRSRPLVGPWLRRLAGPGRPAAPLALCLRLLRRDHDLRLRTLPALATLFVFLGIGLFLRELTDPFAGSPGKAAFSIVVVQWAVLAVPTILHNLCYSRDHAATWLFHAAPQRGREVYTEAMRRVACYAIVLPSLVFLWAVFAWIWRSPGHAALHCASGWFAVVAASHFTVWGMSYPLPLAQPIARGAVSGPVLPYLAGVGVIAMMVGGGEYLTCQSIPGAAAYVGVLGLVALASTQLWRVPRGGRGVGRA